MTHPLTGFILIAVLFVGGSGLRSVAQTLPPAGVAVPNTPGAVRGGPQIQFAESEHDFGKIEGGSSVKFDFVFTNTGTATLEVTDVRSSCGCTTAGAWSKRVEPGQRGTIPIQFNSGAFSGAIHKTVTVTCNIPARPQTVLNLKASVWRAIDVNPTTAYFSPQAEAKTVETKVIRIVNHTEVPLELSPPECANKAFTAELRTLTAGKEFEVHISAKPPFDAGTTQGTIVIQTSSKNLPVITIHGMIMVQLPIVAMPAQLLLGAVPLAAAAKVGVILRNIGGPAVTISEPTVNVPGVAATLKELQPGRIFHIVVDFPAGFDVRPHASAELSVKTSHPLYPIVRVPIVHGPLASQRQAALVPFRPPAETDAVAVPTPQPIPQSPSPLPKP